jgi:ankyrin repeat protein
MTDAIAVDFNEEDRKAKERERHEQRAEMLWAKIRGPRRVAAAKPQQDARAVLLGSNHASGVILGGIGTGVMISGGGSSDLDVRSGAVMIMSGGVSMESESEARRAWRQLIAADDKLAQAFRSIGASVAAGDEAALREALASLRGDKAKLALALGADLPLAGIGQRELLAAAAEKGAEGCVAALLEFGVKDHPGDDGLWAVHRAALSGSAACCALLAARGNGALAKAPPEWGSCSALALAASRGRLDCVEALAPRSDLRQQTGSALGDLTALLCACVNGQIECALALLRAGADVAATGKYGAYEGMGALALWVRQGGSAEGIKALTEAGADPRAPSANGGDALWHAARSGNAAAVGALLPLCDPKKTNLVGVAPLHAAAIAGSLACVERLLPVSDAKAKGVDGFDALGWAAGLGHAECVQALLPWSDPRQTTADAFFGFTALMLAAIHGHARCVQILEPKSDPEQRARDKAEGQSALSLAAEHGRAECVRLLLGHCDPNAADKNGDTALHWAFAEKASLEEDGGKSECAKLLVEAGVDVAKKGGAGKSPLRMALAAGMLDAAEAIAARLGGPLDAAEAFFGCAEASRDDKPAALSWVRGQALAKGAAPAGEETPLMMAARMGWSEGARAMLPWIDASARDAQGLGALDLAVAHQKEACVDVLMAVCDPLAKGGEARPIEQAIVDGRLPWALKMATHAAKSEGARDRQEDWAQTLERALEGAASEPRASEHFDALGQALARHVEAAALPAERFEAMLAVAAKASLWGTLDALVASAPAGRAGAALVVALRGMLPAATARLEGEMMDAAAESVEAKKEEKNAPKRAARRM